MQKPYVMIVVSFLMVSCACNDTTTVSNEHDSSGSMNTKYFKSFASYELPIRPVGQLTREEAKALEKDGYSFHEAEYNDSGELQMLRERYHGIIVAQWDYTYAVTGYIEKCTLTRPSDQLYGRMEQYFDPHGRLIAVKEFDSKGQLVSEEKK